MNRTSVSPLVGWVISALFLLLSIWHFATEAMWQGLAFVALAIVWAVVALRQAKKIKER